MSAITSNVASAAYNTSAVNKPEEADRKKVYGKTIGEPQLSEKAAKYYESLKGKYSNMDFILVSKDQKEQAKANAAQYANPNRMVVLIDEEKIERMANDEVYRKKYEGIIAQSAAGMSDFAKKLGSSGENVKGFGMQVNDNGTTSYFAVLKKSSDEQKVRIEKNLEKKRELKKAENRKAQKEAFEKRLEKAHEEVNKSTEDEEEVTVTASSIEELLRKIEEQTQAWKSDAALTDSEKQVGQNFDFSI